MQDVVVSPIGFLSDHMEVMYDLDEEAAALCRELGVNFVRAGTAGNHPAVIAMLADLIAQRQASPETPLCAIAARPLRSPRRAGKLPRYPARTWCTN